MKRFFVVLLLCVCVGTIGYAEEYDFSAYSDEQLSTLQTFLERERMQRKNAETGKDAVESPVADFLYASNGEEVRINAYIGNDRHVVIPDQIDGMPVTMIADEAFKDKADYIESIVLPQTLKSIGIGAFRYAKNLSGVINLPQELEKVDLQAFDYIGISGLVIQSDCEIDSFAFAQEENLEFVYIHKGSRASIGSYAFSQDSRLKIVVIPESVNSIEDGAFDNCNYVTIYTPKGSYAEQFARRNFIACNTDEYDQYVEMYEEMYPAAVKSTATPTIKPTPTITPTPEPTATPTVKPTPTITPTLEPTATPTANPTSTPKMNMGERTTKQTGNEILFRNNPWSSSWQDIINSLYFNDNISTDAMSGYAEIGLSDWNDELILKNKDSIYVEKGGIELMVYNPTRMDGEKIDLAGYGIFNIDMYFMYKNSSESISREGKDSVFYKAIYNLDVFNTKDAYDDIITKLTNLYGTPKKNKETRKWRVLNSKDYTEYNESAQWLGDNKTTVYIVRNYRIYEDSKTESDAQLKVIYTRTNATTELKKLKMNLDKETNRKEKEKAEKNKDNFNGL